MNRADSEEMCRSGDELLAALSGQAPLPERDTECVAQLADLYGIEPGPMFTVQFAQVLAEVKEQARADVTDD